MKKILVLILIAGCAGGPTEQRTTSDSSNIEVTTANDDVEVIPSETTQPPSIVSNPADAPDTLSSTVQKLYSNKRFKDVSVQKLGPSKFLIKGKGQIFEASFSWVIEDGHEELKQGHEMTDAGAPEWGNFTFTVDATKKRPNSTLHIILFEASAKDGSRQHELPVLLY